MSIKKTILTIHPMIRNLLLLFPVLAIVLLYFLQEGISIDSLKIGRFQFHGLYLKLDNKLTLKLDKLVIPKGKSKRNLGDIDKTLKDIKRVLSYFDYVELNSVKFTDDDYRVVYADSIIYISNYEYEIAGMISPLNGGLTAYMPLIYIKKYDLSFQGNLTYAYASKKATFAGSYSISEVDGNISLEIQNSGARFLLSSKETNSISNLLDRLEIPVDTRVWIDKKVLAKKYKLLSLGGSGKWDKDGFALDMNRLQGSAKIDNVTIAFHKKLKPVRAKQALIKFANNRLDFDLKSPYYNKKRMAGSRVSILNLTGKNHLRLLLGLKFNCQYDSEIDDILKAYDIDIPVKQKKGVSRADIKIDVDLDNGNAKTEGRVFISKGIMQVGGVPLKSNGGEVTFNSKQVALWDVEMHDSWYRGKVNGHINLSTKKAKFKVNLNHLRVGEKSGTSLSIGKKSKLLLNMNFAAKLKFELPALKLKIEQNKHKGIKIISSDIKPLLPYIKGLPVRIDKGKLSLITKNYKEYQFSGETKWKNSYLYDKNNFITQIPFKGIYNGGRLILNALNGKFIYDSKKSLMRLKNINIDAKKMTDVYSSKRSSSKTNKVIKLRAKGANGTIRYGKYRLLSDSFELSIRGKNTTFTATKDGDSIRIEKNADSLVVHANEIKDKMLMALINFNGMQGGRYSLELLGNIKSELRGVINIKGGAIESIKAYNDLVSLLNTIPALMTLSNPGFSKKGFVIKDGKIEFRILQKQNRVIFDNIYFNGKSSTVAGKGSFDIDSGAINIDLAIRTAREIGKVLGSLPIVGYILFGKDKSITTGVKVTGTLENPKVKTNPVQEALLYPLELIKRTVTSPAHIINN